jgi:hypothetical protein
VLERPILQPLRRASATRGDPAGGRSWSTAQRTAPAEDAVNLKKLIAWLVFAMVILYAINSPDHVAQFVIAAGDGLGNVGSALASFIGSLG